MNDSSFGNAAPKNRSINVGANLLGEWIEGQATLRREIRRSLWGLVAVGAVLATGLPILVNMTGDASRRATELKIRVSKLDEALAVAEKSRDEAQPALIVDAMRTRTQASFDRLLQEMDRTLGAGNARTVLSDARCEVQAGELHLVVRADAEEDGAADSFAHSASEEGARVDAITSSRPSSLLGTQGLSFQYEKRVKVTP